MKDRRVFYDFRRGELSKEMYMMKVASPKHCARCYSSYIEVQNDIGSGKNEEVKRTGRKILIPLQ